MSDDLRFDLLKQEYNALRGEILQSISYQHQILLGGYAAAGAFFSYLVSTKSDYLIALIGIPFLFIGMTALWIVECNRMVRASYYIGHVLWPAMQKCIPVCNETSWLSVEWEVWIRRKTGTEAKFRVRQDVAQLTVVLYTPALLSVIAFICAWSAAVDCRMKVSIALMGLLSVLAWCYVGSQARHVSDLGKSEIIR